MQPNGSVRLYSYGSDDSLVPLSFTEYENLEADPENGKTFYVFSDQVGIPLHIEDDQGAVVWWADRVDPYGLIHVNPTSEIEYNLRWPGHYFDPITGLHYNRRRAYDPVLGRYLQSDPIGYKGSEYNLYAYSPNPLVQVDVLGLTCSGHPTTTESQDSVETNQNQKSSQNSADTTNNTRIPIEGDHDFIGPINQGSWRLAPTGAGAHMVERANVRNRPGLADFDQANTPRYYPSGTPEAAGQAHIRLHRATKAEGIRLRGGNPGMSDSDLVSAYDRAYSRPELEGIRGDVRTPSGQAEPEGTNLSPSEAFDYIINNT